MAQREVGRLIEPILARTLFYGVPKQGYQRFFCQHINGFCLRVLLGGPFRGVAHSIQGTLSHDAFVHLSVFQLEEKTGNTGLAKGQVVDGQLLCFQGVKERVRIFLHALLTILANLAELLGIGLYEPGLVDYLLQGLALRLVIVAEDGLAELLHLSDDVPGTVVANLLHDVAQQPLQHDVGVRQRVNHQVDGLFFHLTVVQTDAQVGRQVQFACQIAQHTLEKGVDGLHAEVVVVVQQQVQGFASALADDFGCEPRVVNDALQVVVAVRQTVGNAVQLAEDAHLHLLGGLVGKGDGQNVAETRRVLDEQLDIFYGQGEGLAGTCAGLVNGEWLYHLRNSSKVNFISKLL